MLRACVVVGTSNMEISRRHLADVKKVHQKACRTCSTIIFPYSTKQINHLCRCRCRCWRHFLRPGQTLATFQRNIVQHCCLMMRHLLNGLAKRTQHFKQFRSNMWMLMCPGLWHTTNGPSAHALVQQWTWPNDYNSTQHKKCCTKNLTVFKVDPASSDMSQRGAQTYATCCTQQCCKRFARPWNSLLLTTPLWDSLWLIIIFPDELKV